MPIHRQFHAIHPANLSPIRRDFGTSVAAEMPPTQRLPDAVDRTQLPDSVWRLVPVLACESPHATPSDHFGVRQARRRLLPPLASCAIRAKAALHTSLALSHTTVNDFATCATHFGGTLHGIHPGRPARTALRRHAASHPGLLPRADVRRPGRITNRRLSASMSPDRPPPRSGDPRTASGDSSVGCAVSGALRSPTRAATAIRNPSTIGQPEPPSSPLVMLPEANGPLGNSQPIRKATRLWLIDRAV